LKSELGIGENRVAGETHVWKEETQNDEDKEKEDEVAACQKER